MLHAMELFRPSLQEKDKIKKLIDSLPAEELFCDDDFLADNRTLHTGNSDREESSDIKWLRPKVRSIWDCRFDYLVQMLGKFDKYRIATPSTWNTYDSFSSPFFNIFYL